MLRVSKFRDLKILGLGFSAGSGTHELVFGSGFLIESGAISRDVSGSQG